MSITERNRRFHDGWVPPELAERYGKTCRRSRMGSLFDPKLGPGITKVLKALNSGGPKRLERRTSRRGEREGLRDAIMAPRSR